MKTIRILAIASGLCLIGTIQALAHTQLSESVPAHEAVLEAAPEHLSLSFSEPVRLTAVELRIDADATCRADLEALEVALPVLEPGDYLVEWRALSEDTHVISGDIRFTVSP